MTELSFLLKIALEQVGFVLFQRSAAATIVRTFSFCARATSSIQTRGTEATLCDLLQRLEALALERASGIDDHREASGDGSGSLPNLHTATVLSAIKRLSGIEFGAE